MFIFDEANTPRVLTRKALGYQTFEINEDVCNGDEVTLAFDGSAIRVSKADGVAEDCGGQPIDFLLKEIGLFGNLESQIEVTFCDDYMLVTLNKGGIDIRMAGQTMFASVGIDDSAYRNQNFEHITWVSVEKLLALAEVWCDDEKTDFAKDYIYLITIKGSNDTGNHSMTVRPANDSKAESMIDISQGRIDAEVERRQLRENVWKTKQTLASILGNKPKPKAIDDLVFNEDDYLDEEDDFYDEGYYDDYYDEDDD